MANFSRRAALGLVGAGALWPRVGRAGVAVERVEGMSRLDRDPYEPPTSVQAVGDMWRRMTVPVKVEGAGPFPFVVDTGANQSVISFELAAQLHLPLGPAAPLNGIAGVQMAPVADGALALGRLPPETRTLSVLPASGIGGPGMLGLDYLGHRRLVLDFGRQSLTVEAADRPAIAQAGDIVAKATRRDSHLILVEARLDRMPVAALIDSGAQTTIGNLALKSRALARSLGAGRETVPLLSATGQTIDAVMAQLPRLELAGVLIDTWSVAFADLHPFAMWKLDTAPALLLGVDLLSRFETVTLDFQRQEVRLQLPGGQRSI